MPRKSFMASALACGFLVINPHLSAAQQPHPIRIDTGKVQGVLTADRKVVAYKGIPYAGPPVEELRWRPPQPAPRWKGVFEAREFGSHCVQFGAYPDMVFHDPGPSEDCLTLNVWAPAEVNGGKKSGGLPVMVWIYGGGFQTGGTSENRQDGEFLAHRGVIVVSMNYRLGLFGFLALPELDSESPHHTSGNYGLMDQTAAINWVRRNIGAFGGDPNNITIFGESAGSESVSAQMASPLAAGLFAKAIGESGSLFPAPQHVPLSLEQAERGDQAWAERALGSARLFYLRQLSTDEIVTTAMDRSRRAPSFSAIIDGWFLPDSLPHIYGDGKQAHIPTLGGWNANESRAEKGTTLASFTQQAKSEFGADAQKFLALYPATSEEEALRSAGDYASDKFIAYRTWAWLEAQAQTGHAPVYRYFFDLASPGDRNHSVAAGAFHSDDIEYVFGTLDSRPQMKIRPDDRALSELMQQYWVNFAGSGDPNGPGLPQWPTYSASANGLVMNLDASPHAEPDKLRDRYLFLDKAWSGD